jgi:two-component system nitrate/nitrite response regulator NarP
MMTTLPTGKTVVEIVVFGRSPLVAKYIQHTLRAQKRWRVSSCNNLEQLAIFTASSTVVVFDSGNLFHCVEKSLALLRMQVKQPKVIVIGGAVSGDQLLGLLAVGVRGYVVYDCLESTLARAIVSAAAGQIWASPQIVERFLEYATGRLKPERVPNGRFTRRQMEIFNLVARRLSNKEISSTMGISESTVKYHLASIFAKAGVHSRYDLSDPNEGITVLAPEEAAASTLSNTGQEALM